MENMGQVRTPRLSLHRVSYVISRDLLLCMIVLLPALGVVKTISATSVILLPNTLNVVVTVTV